MPMMVGTSGWSYDDWVGGFYPKGVSKRRWLEHYAESFDTVENNSAFYYPVARRTFEGWRERLPDGFVMAVKASRELTHTRRLKDPKELVEGLVEAARGLGDRLGPILLQLPPRMRAAPDRLDECLRCFPGDVRVAVEPRHDSWWTDEVRTVLERHGAALCWADMLDKPATPLWRTAGWAFVRLHEGTAEPWPMYDQEVVERWMDDIDRVWRKDEDVFVYFNNNPGGAAVHGAIHLASLARDRGWDVTRTPAAFPELQPASREWNTPW
ncbi:DUF72 domain-containing protein [Actinomadura kijaniata]|uniref:DUF72 domain-containing protein n=1 Tax=Actinomadura kijaniata TaxID=46161 RepID=UPI00082AF2A0|nr:DUF72 domain-containing protein [Actinomadura kijaniata]